MYGQKPPKKKKPVKRKSDSELSARSLAVRKAYEEQQAKKQQAATTYSGGTKRSAKPTTQKQIKSSQKAKNKLSKPVKGNGISGSCYGQSAISCGGATVRPDGRKATNFRAASQSGKGFRVTKRK